MRKNGEVMASWKPEGDGKRMRDHGDWARISEASGSDLRVLIVFG